MDLRHRLELPPPGSTVNGPPAIIHSKTKQPLPRLNRWPTSSSTGPSVELVDPNNQRRQWRDPTPRPPLHFSARAHTRSLLQPSSEAIYSDHQRSSLSSISLRRPNFITERNLTATTIMTRSIAKKTAVHLTGFALSLSSDLPLRFNVSAVGESLPPFVNFVPPPKIRKYFFTSFSLSLTVFGRS